MYVHHDQETELNVQEGEYALSRDLAVSLWAYYGEAFCGNFIISNENLQDKFEKFSTRGSSYIDASYNMVKANELPKIWLISCDISLKFMNVLGSLMDGSLVPMGQY